MSSRRQLLLARVNWYLQSSLKHITELITGNKSYNRGGRYRQVSTIRWVNAKLVLIQNLKDLISWKCYNLSKGNAQCFLTYCVEYYTLVDRISISVCANQWHIFALGFAERECPVVSVFILHLHLGLGRKCHAWFGGSYISVYSLQDVRHGTFNYIISKIRNLRCEVSNWRHFLYIGTLTACETTSAEQRGRLTAWKDGRYI